MKSNDKKGLENILQALENFIEPLLEKLKYDKTYRGKVISDKGSGLYSIQINGKEYDIQTESTSLVINSVIKVKAPLNNFSDIYVESAGGGGSGTTDYTLLVNKPKINNVELVGNKSISDLGLQPAGSYVVDANYVHTDNNYTSIEQTKLSNITGTNTGDETLSTIKTKLGITTLSGSNTGDETLSTIKTKLGVTTLSGSNTGDETLSTIKTKLGITTLSGSNTGDQTTISGNAGTATKLETPRAINGVNFDGTAPITIVDSTKEPIITKKTGFNLDLSVTATDIKMNGVQSLGVATTLPKSDHVHPSDTSKVSTTRTVAGKPLSADITLVKSDVGLGNVDNTSDVNKPVVTTTVNGIMSSTDKIKLDGLVTNATHTGDVTGSQALTITAKAVTNAKLADMVTKTYKGRTSAGTGVPEDISIATMKTDLAINNVDNTSDLNKPISNATQTALNGKSVFVIVSDNTDVDTLSATGFYTGLFMVDLSNTGTKVAVNGNVIVQGTAQIFVQNTTLFYGMNMRIGNTGTGFNNWTKIVTKYDLDNFSYLIRHIYTTETNPDMLYKEGLYCGTYTGLGKGTLLVQRTSDGIESDVGVTQLFISKDNILKTRTMYSIDEFITGGIDWTAWKSYGTTINNLTSTSTTDNLSANQGKVLYDKFKEYVLYNNTAGSQATIILSDSAANYNYIEIFYVTGSIYYASTKQYAPNGKRLLLDCMLYYNGMIQVRTSSVDISGTSLTWAANYYMTIDGTVSYATDTKIVRIVGYK